MTGTTLAVFLAVILPTAAAADDRGSRPEEGDRAALRDDLRDAERAQALLDDFDRAAAAPNALSLAFIEGRVTDALRDELAEASRETAQTGREAQRSEEEIRHDRADAARDRHDFIEKAEYRRRIQGLAGEWSRLKGLRRPAAMQRKHDILVDLVRLSHFEIRSDVRQERGDRRDRH